MNNPQNTLYVGWTTFPDLSTAESFAEIAVKTGAAVCAQVDGPITSYYLWHGTLEKDQEVRVMVKFWDSQRKALESLFSKHPYEVPQWIATPLPIVGEPYRTWANAFQTKPPHPCPTTQANPIDPQ